MPHAMIMRRARGVLRPAGGVGDDAGRGTSGLLLRLLGGRCRAACSAVRTDSAARGNWSGLGTGLEAAREQRWTRGGPGGGMGESRLPGRLSGDEQNRGDQRRPKHCSAGRSKVPRPEGRSDLAILLCVIVMLLPSVGGLSLPFGVASASLCTCGALIRCAPVLR